MMIYFVSLGGTYPYRIGGPAVVSYNLINQYSNENINVNFYYGISKNHFFASTEYFKKKFVRNITPIPIIKNNRDPNSYSTFIDSHFIKDMLRLFNEKYDCNLIHFCFLPNTKDILMLVKGRLKKLPIIYNIHGWTSLETKYSQYNKLRKYHDLFSLKFMNNSFDVIVCNSQQHKEKVIREGINEDKIEIIPNGVDLKQYNNASKVTLVGNPVLLFVGRLEYIKGVDVVVQAIRDIIKDIPTAVLHIIGSGSLERHLKKYVTNIGLDDNVVFHGDVYFELPSYYAASDIVISIGRYESFGLVALEAMAAGKPIIATSFNQNLEDHKNAIIIKPNVQELIDATGKLWMDKRLLNSMKKNNLLKAKDFDWSIVAKKYVDLYDSLV